MSLFTPDFAAVDAGFPMYDKGLYRVKITKRLPFVRESKPDSDGNVKVLAGVYFNLEMAGKHDEDGELQTDGLAGKSVSRHTIWTHSEGGWQFGKSFLMAACGYAKNQENEANEDLFQGGDWGFSGDVGDTEEAIELGNSWDEPVDRFVDVQMHVERTLDESGNVTFEEQVFDNWYPVN